MIQNNKQAVPSNLVKQRRLVISDIHGCNKTFRALLNQINPQKEDLIYLLGDYIDRGPDSPGVIDTIIDLMASGYQVFPLIGNHEFNILQAFKEYEKAMFVHFVSKINKSGALLEADGTIKKKYFDFISGLKDYYVEFEHAYLVHAGFNFSIPNPFDDTVGMIEQRRTIPNKTLVGDKFIIHGHNVTYLDDIISAIENKHQVIPLDNGCVYKGRHKIYDTVKTGHLCCLNIDSFELQLQANIEHD